MPVTHEDRALYVRYACCGALVDVTDLVLEALRQKEKAEKAERLLAALGNAGNRGKEA